MDVQTTTTAGTLPPMRERDAERPPVRGEPTGDGVRAAGADDLLPLVYAQLRAAAKAQLDAESPAHTLQPTALVHEVYLRLSAPRQVPWANRAHFYAAAAQAMRRILIDHARARRARGGRPHSLDRAASAHGPADLDEAPRPLDTIRSVADLAEASIEQIEAFDTALERLERDEPDAAAMLRLRFFAGLSREQTAEVMGISTRSYTRLWTYARARLYRDLSDDRPSSSSAPSAPEESS